MDGRMGGWVSGRMGGWMDETYILSLDNFNALCHSTSCVWRYDIT